MTTRRWLLAIAAVAILLGGAIALERAVEAARLAALADSMRVEARQKRAMLEDTLRDSEDADEMGDYKRAMYLRNTMVLEAFRIGRLEDAARVPWNGRPDLSVPPPVIHPDGTMIFHFEQFDPTEMARAKALVAATVKQLRPPPAGGAKP
jgi:hypothetical protein